MCNALFAAGVLPASHKLAIVKPRLKKATWDPDDLNSYRPISNFNFISKTIERVMAVRFMEHCEANKQLSMCQSAYRAFQSTKTAISIVHNNIVQNIEQKRLSARFVRFKHRIRHD